MDLLKYLERIKFSGRIDTSLETLRTLQQQHLFNIPFGNLDIHYGRRIELDKTYEKIINKKREGFCYELNGLFFELLKELGFKVQLVSARVWSKETGYGPEYDHMAIITEIDGEKWLVDAGFGEFALWPLKIDADAPQKDPRGNFRITRSDNTFIVYKEENGIDIPQYSFTDTERQLSDFLEMCHYHQTSPDSHFTQKRLCSIMVEDGRITISGNKLLTKKNDVVTESGLTNEDDFIKVLWNVFKIELDATYSTNK